MFKKVFVLISLFIIPFVGFAYTNPGVSSGFVNDFTGVLDIADRQQLETKLSNFEKETSNEISVVIISSLDGDTIENYAVNLFEDWGIGKKGKDNGVLILVSIADRKMRIEVGYGLEGALTDAQSSWIINNELKPEFQKGNFYQGINAAVDKIIAATRGEYVPAESSKNKSMGLEDYFWMLLYFPFIIFTWLARILARTKSWWLGGVIGLIAGIVTGFFKGFVFLGFGAMGIFAILGLLLDFFVSRNYQKISQRGGAMPWWLGGRFPGGSGGSGSHFGGFGGGRSGGGGSSGDW